VEGAVLQHSVPSGETFHKPVGPLSPQFFLDGMTGAGGVAHHVCHQLDGAVRHVPD
jgi:hypothetical protein